jgi:hypothetical protein
MSTLPANPFTLSDTRPQANTWTPDDIDRRYAGCPLNEHTFKMVRRDLAELRAWDDYERATTVERDAVKQSLRRILNREL